MDVYFKSPKDRPVAIFRFLLCMIFLVASTFMMSQEMNKKQTNGLDTAMISKTIVLEKVEIINRNKKGYKSAEKTIFKIDTRGLLKSAKADIALKRLPNVMYSNEGFILMGNTKRAKILVNSIESSEEELSKIDVKDIDKVELYQVGANDDTHAGQINIILKREHSNIFKGDIDTGADLLRPNFNMSPSLTYRSKKVDFITWASYVNDRQENEYKVDRGYRDFFSSKSENKLQQYSLSSKINVFFSSKWRFSLSYSLFGYENAANILGYLEGDKQPDRQVNSVNVSNFANMVLRYDKNSNNRFFIKTRYFNYKSTNSSSSVLSEFTGQMNEGTGDVLFESDSTYLFNKYHNFAVGYKSIYRNSMLTLSNKAYISDVQQLYMKDSFTFADKWDMFLSLRSEWAGYKLENTNPFRNFSFLPSISLNYKSKIGNLSIAHTKSVERPNVDYLNPDIFYINDLNKIKGNPNLEMQYANKYTLNYSKQAKAGYIGIIASFEDTKNLIEKVYIENYDTSTYENVGRGQIFRFNVAYNKSLFSNSFAINASAGVGHASFQVAPQFLNKVLIAENNRGWYFMGSLNLSYMMPKDWFINFSINNYVDKTITLNMTHYKKPMLDLLITKSFFKNTLDISVMYMDMFGLFSKQKIEYNFRDINQQAISRLPIHRLTVSLVYRFGKQFKNRNIGNDITNDDITTK